MRSIRRDKRSHIDNLPSHAEEAAAQGNMRELYNTTKKLAAQYQLKDKTIEDKGRKNIDIRKGTAKEMGEAFQ